MQLHSLMIDGQQIGYRQSMGSGPAVLLLPSNSSSGLAYECQLDDEIGLLHRLVAVDLPGSATRSRLPILMPYLAFKGRPT